MNVSDDFWSGFQRRDVPGQGDAFDVPVEEWSRSVQSCLERGQTSDFDAQACIELCVKIFGQMPSQYRRSYAVNQAFYQVYYSDVQCDEQEALFWLEVFLREEFYHYLDGALAWEEKDVRAYCAEILEALEAGHRRTLDETRQGINALFSAHMRSTYPSERSFGMDMGVIPWSLAAVYRPREVVDLLFSLDIGFMTMAGWFRYTGSTEGDEEYTINALRQRYSLEEFKDEWTSYGTVMFSSVLMRCPDEEYVRACLPQFNKYHMYSDEARCIPLIFKDKDEVVDIFKSMNVPLDASKVHVFYARYGREGFEDLSALIMRRENKKRRVELLKALWPVCASELAELMLTCEQDIKTREVAQAWLYNQGADATLGLMELVGRRGKKKVEALAVLRELVSRGHGDEIRGLLGEVSTSKIKAEIEAEVLAFESTEGDLKEVDTDELPDFLSEVVERYDASREKGAFKAELESFLTIENLPALIFKDGEGVLHRDHQLALLWAVSRAYWMDWRQTHGANIPKMKQTSTALMALLDGDVIRDAFDHDSLSACMRHVIECWWGSGFEHRQGWCIWLFGLGGQDQDVFWMEEKLRNAAKWFPKAYFRTYVRAVLDNFVMINTPTSLMIFDVLQEGRCKEKIRKEAATHRRELCELRGWTEQNWRDRTVPYGGLDDNGTRVYDYGERTFKLKFRGAFDVFFEDEKGKQYKSLPASRKTDDVNKVGEARADYKVIKKQLTTIIAQQTQRFEDAVREQHAWKVEDWVHYVGEHPLLRHFARKLVWCIKKEGWIEEVEKSFIWSEDGSAMSADYEEIDLSVYEDSPYRIYLMHPVDMTPEQKAVWIDVLGEFEVIQPVEQLERKVLTDYRGLTRDILKRMKEENGYAYYQNFYKYKLPLKFYLSNGWFKRFNMSFGGLSVMLVSDEAGVMLLKKFEGKEELFLNGLYAFEGDELDPDKFMESKNVPMWFYSEFFVSLCSCLNM